MMASTVLGGKGALFFRAALYAVAVWLGGTAIGAAQEDHREIGPVENLPCTEFCRAWMGRPEPSKPAAPIEPIEQPRVEQLSRPRAVARTERVREPRRSGRAVAERRQGVPLAPPPPVVARVVSPASRPSALAKLPAAERRPAPATNGGAAATQVVVEPPPPTPAIPHLATAGEPTPDPPAAVLSERARPTDQSAGAPEPAATDASSEPARRDIEDEARRTAAINPAPMDRPPSEDGDGLAEAAREQVGPAQLVPRSVHVLIASETDSLRELDGRPVAAVGTPGSAGTRSPSDLFLASGLGIRPIIVDVASGSEGVALLWAGEVDAVLIAGSDAGDLTGVPLEGLRRIVVPMAGGASPELSTQQPADHAVSSPPSSPRP